MRNAAKPAGAPRGNHTREHMLKMNRARWAKFYEEKRPAPVETPALNWVHKGGSRVK
jgi:hypothetical protein